MKCRKGAVNRVRPRPHRNSRKEPGSQWLPSLWHKPGHTEERHLFARCFKFTWNFQFLFHLKVSYSLPCFLHTPHKENLQNHGVAAPPQGVLPCSLQGSGAPGDGCERYSVLARGDVLFRTAVSFFPHSWFGNCELPVTFPRSNPGRRV